MEQEPGEEYAKSMLMEAADYVKTARACLREGQQKKAYQVLQAAMLRHPDNAIILSYYGYLQAVVDRKYQSGVAACRRSFVVFRPADSRSARMLYPILYLNLGRTWIAAGRKRDAIDAFNRGLKHDKSHADLRRELRSLGVRKKPPISFLSRSNPINKYMGLLLGSSRRSSNH